MIGWGKSENKDSCQGFFVLFLSWAIGRADTSNEMGSLGKAQDGERVGMGDILARFCFRSIYKNKKVRKESYEYRGCKEVKDITMWTF